MSVAEAVRGRLDRFPPRERRVARALLADYPRAGLGSAAELAAAAGVSAPTVVRFARTLGHTGFADLQATLLGELSDRAASPISRYHDEVAGRAERSAGQEHWLDAALPVITTAISSSLAAIPRTELDAAVTLLADPALRVHVLGGRYTGYLARYVALHLQQVRPRVVVGDETLRVGAAEAIDAGRRDCYLIYDVRRYQADTVATAQALAARGVRIVCVTDRWLSPVARVAEVVLPTAVDSPGPFDSAAAAFVLGELLIEAVRDRLGEKALRRMQAFEAAGATEVLGAGAPGPVAPPGSGSAQGQPGFPGGRRHDIVGP